MLVALVVVVVVVVVGGGGGVVVVVGGSGAVGFGDSDGTVAVDGSVDGTVVALFAVAVLDVGGDLMSLVYSGNDIFCCCCCWWC